MAIHTNGKPQRKQLSDQLDRFDTMLDGLSQALNESIADAVRDGTRLALKDAVIEILTDPSLRAKLRDATEPVKVTPVMAKKWSFWDAAKAKVGAAGRALKNAAALAVGSVLGAAHTVVTTVRNPGRIATALNGLKRLLGIGASAGLAIAVISYFAPHAISAALSGIAAGAVAISLRLGTWSRRAVRPIVA